MEKDPLKGTVVVGDVGGTNARLAVVTAGPERPEMLAERTYPSRDFASLEEVVAAFEGESPPARSARRACFGIAGPVVGNRSEATNLPWVVDGARVAEAAGISEVLLLNDLEAAAWGLGDLAPETVRTLAAGAPAAAGNRALLAPGTGLGQALLVWDGTRHLPSATEGGHADFAPGDELQVELWRYLARRHGHVSWERVLSGPGIVALFRFLLEREGREEPPWLRQEAAEGDPAAAITQRARDGSCPLCRTALDLFFALLGAEAGNLALRTLATGGLYLAGGILPKVQAELEASTFLAAFLAKGRFRALLETVPVHLVLDDRLALWGAARAVQATPPGPAKITKTDR